jgi:hypothetical protein
MKLFIILILFTGILMVVQGVYNDQLKMVKEKVKVEYRFVPRSYYDEMMFSQQFSSLTNDLFNSSDGAADEWYKRNIGGA